MIIELISTPSRLLAHGAESSGSQAEWKHGMVNELKRRVDVPESSHAAKHARSDDTDQREWGLKPEHTIFLSHSGKQKNFTEHLCKELKRAHHRPFLDKDSLPKGHDFPSAIIQAARQCHVAILVLSEDFFTRSRWPMIELNEFVKAQASPNSKLKLLPLFYKLSVEEFKDAERQKRWQEIWKGWAAEDERSNKTHKIDVCAWASALSAVGRITGEKYDEEVGEVTYVENVVEAVRKLKVPRVKYDISHVQSLQRFSEAIFAKFQDSKDDHCGHQVQVVGLFGMGGVGKTTITKAMCNGDFGDFDGDFCHVELGVKDVGVVRRQVLQDLMGETSFLNDLDKLKMLLNKCMQQQKVFLCLDNVWPGDIEEARMFLQLNFKVGSKVLVTSRSYEVLERLGLKDCQCMEMPEMDKCDSTKLFLHYVGMVSTNDINEQEWDVINGCVQACHFLKPSSHGVMNNSSTKQYLPLALKVWGTQLGQISRCPLEWKKSLEDLKIHKFNHFNDDTHPLFSLLRQGYDSLNRKEQLIFFDLAIFVTHATNEVNRFTPKCDIGKWLQHAHGCKVSSILQSLEALKRKALLDFAMTNDGLEFWIHDLYLEFAQEEIQALELSGQTSPILYDFGGVCLPSKLRRKKECQDLKRMGIYESKVKSIKKDDLLHCSQVEVFQVYGCKNLEELDVEGMDGLRILDVVGCEKLGEKFRGVNRLKDLEWLRLHILNCKFFLGDFSSLTTLQFLELLGDDINDGWMSFFGYENLVNLGNLTMLENVTLSRCYGIKSMIVSNTLTNLKLLDLSFCSSLIELPGLYNLVVLETLDLSGTGILELPGLGKLQHLEVLDVVDCGSLTSLVELEYVTSLYSLRANYCHSLHELPNMSNLTRLKEVELPHSGISIIPSGFGRVARNCIIELSGCLELLEPLVIWLWEQELQSVEELHDNIFPDLTYIEESEDELRSNIRKRFVYYIYQITSDCFRGAELASIHNSLGEKEGGIDFVIKALCEHEDLGILSLVIAKYSTEIIATSIIPKLSSRIIDFLNQQLDHSMSASNLGIIGVCNSPAFWRILFILEHVMKNDMLVKSLEVDNIHLVIKKFALEYRYSCIIPNCLRCRNDCELIDLLESILRQWSRYLNRCCY